MKNEKKTVKIEQINYVRAYVCTYRLVSCGPS